MMVCTPLPSSPTTWAHACSNSTSLDAFARLPILSFSRWIWKALRLPSEVQRGRRKQLRPCGACAKTRNASHIGAETNHLCPVIKYSRELPIRSARVVLALTSEPPCFSVIPMPSSTPDFSLGGTKRGSYVDDIMRGSHSAARSGSSRNEATAENVIDIGQVCPASFCAVSIISAARAT